MKLFEPDDNDSDDEEYFEELPPDAVSESQARASAHGRAFDLEAFDFLHELGVEILETYVRVDGYPLDAVVRGANGAVFYVDAHGTPDRADRAQAGIRRTDTLLKFGFKALRLEARGRKHPLLLLTSHMPKPKMAAGFLLAELAGVLFDVVAIRGDLAGYQRLRRYFNDDLPIRNPLAAPWREASADMRQVQLELKFDEGEDDEEEHQ